MTKKTIEKAFHNLDSLSEKQLKDLSYIAYEAKVAVKKFTDTSQEDIKVKSKRDFLKNDYTTFVTSID